MTSQVYYRRWRPSSFDDLVGQEHVATTLRQAIKQDRVAHSYLFSGPRGTGKTTTARIVAKAVNCLDPQEGDPCNACVFCRSANEERFIDTIELDAASNRGIEDIRDIRDKVNFAPAEGRRKVYIIDEAHMLTDQASNAFLKTLEEPPAHVIFILCTTEANRISPTIISRCQRFGFRRLPSEQIYRRLVEVAAGEGVSVAPDALQRVARYADGSLRDAENLLEQLVISWGDDITLAQTEDLLGLGYHDGWLDLVKYLLTGNASAALEGVNQAAWDGTDLRQLHRQVLELLRGAMLLEWGAGQTLELPEQVTTQLQGLVDNLPNWRITNALRRWSEVNMRYDAPSTLPLELAVVEICNADLTPAAELSGNRTSSQAARETRPRSASGPAATPAATAAPAPAAAPTTAPAQQREAPRTGAMDNTNPPPEASRKAPEGSRPSGPPEKLGEFNPNDEADFALRWQAMVKALSRHKGGKYNLGALLRGCKADNVSLNDDTLVLPFAHSANMERMQEEMGFPDSRRMVSEAVTQFFGSPYEFKVTLVNNGEEGRSVNRPNQHSPLVRTALNMGARIVEDAVE